MKRIFTRTIQTGMWAAGRPTQGPEFANLYRAALKVGLNERQATALVQEAFDASKCHEWKLGQGTALQLHTQARLADELKARNARVCTKCSYAETSYPGLCTKCAIEALDGG